MAASSTQCARCSQYISLSDVDIRSHHSRNIQTRGNVVIHRRGSVIGCEIACHDLTVLGKISGSVDCSGNATFKNSGKVLGSMHCKHIVVDKKCELDFPQGIIAESADIHGVVRGDILCSGTIQIFKTGSVLGDATARAVVVKDGGVLTGQMRIQHGTDISLPEKGSVRPQQPEVPGEISDSSPSDPVPANNEKEQEEEEEGHKDQKSNKAADKTDKAKSKAPRNKEQEEGSSKDGTKDQEKAEKGKNKDSQSDAEKEKEADQQIESSRSKEKDKPAEKTSEKTSATPKNSKDADESPDEGEEEPFRLEP